MATDPNYRDPNYRDPALHDDHVGSDVRTTGSTPNDPVRRDPAVSQPNHADPAYRREAANDSGWMKWAAVAAALVLGVFLLTSLFSADEAGEEVATNTADTVIVADPVAPADTTEAVPVTPAPTEAETPIQAPAEAPAAAPAPATQGELDPNDPNVNVVPLQNE